MSEVSIPCVAHFPLEGRPAKVDPFLLTSAVRIPPDLYLDDKHHRSIYCLGCGVMCSRIPRKKAKRKDNVHAFYAHIRGFDDVGCPHRKPGYSASVDGNSVEKKAINLVAFAGWKTLDDDIAENEEDEQVSKSKRVVQGRTARDGQEDELVFDADGSLFHVGKFRTVRSLVMHAQVSLDKNVQFSDQETTRLGDLIISIEKILKDLHRHIGKSFLFFGQPKSVNSGPHDVFLNFSEGRHHLAGICDPRIFEQRGWRTSELGHYYAFYGMLEVDESYLYVRIMNLGQIDRPPVSANSLFDSLR